MSPRATMVGDEVGGDEVDLVRDATHVHKTVAVSDDLATVRDMEDDPEYGPHIELSERSKTTPLAVPRTVADAARIMPGGARYVHDARARARKTLHHGQRKLGVSLIDVVSRCVAKGIKARDILVVYVGASIPASLAAVQVFDGVLILGFDSEYSASIPVARGKLKQSRYRSMLSLMRGPLPTAYETARLFERKSTRVVFHLGEGGYFTDSSCEYAALVAERMGRVVAFVTDFRRNDDTGLLKEEHIVEDMIDQARFARLIRPSAFSLKFRLPFDAEKHSARYRDGVARSQGVADGLIPYLDGELCLQAHARETTTELRLVSCALPGDDPTASTVGHDPAFVERTMAPFNLIHRQHSAFRGEGGGAQNFDDALEALVLEGAVRESDSRSGDAALADFARFFARGGDAASVCAWRGFAALAALTVSSALMSALA